MNFGHSNNLGNCKRSELNVPSFGDRWSLSIAKNHPKPSQEFSEQFGPSIHEMKGFGRNSPQNVHPNFAQSLGRQILGNTFPSPNPLRRKIASEPRFLLRRKWVKMVLAPEFPVVPSSAVKIASERRCTILVRSSFAPYRGRNPQNWEKRLSESKKPPFPTMISQKRVFQVKKSPFSFWCSVLKWGFFDSADHPFLGWWEMGVFDSETFFSRF